MKILVILFVISEIANAGSYMIQVSSDYIVDTTDANYRQQYSATSSPQRHEDYANNDYSVDHQKVVQRLKNSWIPYEGAYETIIQNKLSLNNYTSSDIQRNDIENTSDNRYSHNVPEIRLQKHPLQHGNFKRNNYWQEQKDNVLSQYDSSLQYKPYVHSGDHQKPRSNIFSEQVSTKKPNLPTKLFSYSQQSRYYRHPEQQQNVVKYWKIFPSQSPNQQESFEEEPHHETAVRRKYQQFNRDGLPSYSRKYPSKFKKHYKPKCWSRRINRPCYHSEKKYVKRFRRH